MPDVAGTFSQLAASLKGEPEKLPEGPNSAADFRRNRNALVRLPSGNVMRLKRVGIFDVIEQGMVPQTLSTQAAAVAGPGLKTMTEEQIKQYIGVVNVVVCACASEPKVSMRQPEAALPDDTLYVDELNFFDREAIFKWGCGLASSLQPFRPQPVAALPDTPDR